MDNVIILTTWTGWEIEEWKNNKILAEDIFSPVPKFIRAIRRICVQLGLPFQSIWYTDWEEKVKKADVVIMHVTSLSLALGKRINRINPNARVIAWYWNRVDKMTRPDKLKGNIECWSFDPEDCREYSMHYNHQYYFKSLAISGEKIMWDVYFCGHDAGRGERITRIYELFLSLGFKVKFQVVDSQYDGMPDELRSQKLDYIDVRKNVARSNALLEIMRESQSGATLRTMEAIFFQKKLITDNHFVKEEAFYNENNIFVLGEDSDIAYFMKRKFVPYDDSCLDSYDVSQWLNNFLKTKN